MANSKQEDRLLGKESNPRLDKGLAAKYEAAERKRNKAKRPQGPSNKNRPADPGVLHALSTITTKSSYFAVLEDPRAPLNWMGRR